MLAQPSVSQNEAESGSDEETGKTAQHTDYFAYEINKTENASAAFSYSVSLDFDQPVDILADIEDKNVTIEDVAYTLYHIHTDEEGNQAVSEIVPDVNFQDRNIYGFSFTTAFFGSQSYTGVAEEEGKILGLYILHPNNVGRCGHICNASYAVSSDIRGKHIGEKLVLDCLKKGRELGFRVLQFNAVVESNIHARHLYERLGFIQLGTIPGGFRMKDGHYENICPYYHEL